MRTDAQLSALTAPSLKETLARFCTGVVLITGRDGEGPLGFTAQSFVSVSLEPPLVSFCPAKTSESWPRIRRSGRFCVNVLSEAQHNLCFRFAKKGVERFEGVGWQTAPGGFPRVENALAWFDCGVEVEHDAGDHHIVIGRIWSFTAAEQAELAPLIFYRRQLGKFSEL